MSKARHALLVFLALNLVAAVGMLISIAVNVATSVEGVWPAGLGALRERPFLWTVALTAIAAVLAFTAWKLQERAGSQVEDPPAPPLPDSPDWVVGRPHELEQAVRAVRGRDGRAVGITTALQGAGGFGKSTLAAIVSRDPRVRRRFRNRIYPITIGRDIRGRAAIAERVNVLIGLITGEDGGFDDPRAAGQHLGRLLDQRPRLLLVIDDVWEAEQLEPFLLGGRRTRRLVTTRVRRALPTGAIPVDVDQMSMTQARAVLVWQLAGLEPKIVEGLLAATGRWPLLLRLINRVIADEAATGVGPTTTAADILVQLGAAGPAGIDALGGPTMSLDVNDPAQRSRAVRATIEASTRLLPGSGASRFAELGIFAEDEAIPRRVVEALWLATAGLDRGAARQLCRELARLSLVRLDADAEGSLGIHDVLRDYLRAELGESRIAAVNAALVDSLAATLQPVSGSGRGTGHPSVAWWEAGHLSEFVAENLIYHLLAAGRNDAAEATACDIRWVEHRLLQFGPAAVQRDLEKIPAERARSMLASFAQATHLLAPTDPTSAVLHILYSRLNHDPYWGNQMPAASQATARRPLLANRWSLPDTPDPATRRTLASPGLASLSLVAAPNSAWLATTSHNGTIRIWDIASGHQKAAIPSDKGLKTFLVAPDSSWLATNGRDGRVRIWDTTTGHQKAELPGDKDYTSMRVAADSSWLATKDDYGKLKIWDPATGHLNAALHGRSGMDASVVVSPDSSWLATASLDGKVRIWDTATGNPKPAPPGQKGCTSMWVAPDSRWIATTSRDGTLRIWDTTTGSQKIVPTDHTGAAMILVVSQDGTWLATAGKEGTVRIWDTATGNLRTILFAHRAGVRLMVYPRSGSWLGTAGEEGTVRIWDPTTGQLVSDLHNVDYMSMVEAPDGTWLATAGRDARVRIWNPTTGRQHAALTLTGQSATVRAMVIAPNGRWLAAAAGNGMVRIWDTPLDERQAERFGRHQATNAAAVARDGTWLATTGNDGMIRIWNPTSGDQTAVFTGGGLDYESVAISADGTWLAATGSDGIVCIWDKATGDETARLLAGRMSHTSVVIAPDGTWLATMSGDNTVQIWNPTTGDQTAVLIGHKDLRLQAAAVSPDGNWLAIAGNDGTIRIWDPTTGDETAFLTGRRHYRARTVAIAPAGTWLVTRGTDNAVRIWTRNTGKQTALRARGRLNYRGTPAAIAPDGTWVATTGDDGTVRIWDPATGGQIALLPDHWNLRVQTVAVAPDGTWLATAGRDGTVRVWAARSWECVALMRTDGPLNACVWMPDGSGLCLVGSEGIYLYDFHPPIT